MRVKEVRESIRGKINPKPSRRLFDFVKETKCVRTHYPKKVGDCIRASSLGYLCVREEILASRHEIIREEHLQQTLQITFDIGNVFHDLFREEYFGPMGEWGGAWECLHCGWDTDDAGVSEQPQIRGGIARPGRPVRLPFRCGGCGAPFIRPPHFEGDITLYGRFKEWLIKDEQLCLDGHPDGWSMLPLRSRRVVDLKSQSASGFPNRLAPEPEHVLQVTGYEHLCGDKEGAVWYVNKSPWGDSPSFLRDFEVLFDLSFFKKNVVKQCELLQNGLAGGSLPERTCVSKDFPRARKCQLVDFCFEG